jgi:predicted RNase H-like nuclease (RuvC/YqgF family)
VCREVNEARSVEQAKDIEKLRETNTTLEQSLDQLRDEVFESKRKLGLKVRLLLAKFYDFVEFFFYFPQMLLQDVEVKSLQDRAGDLQSQLDSAVALSESSRRNSSATGLHSDQLSIEKRKLEARVQEYQVQISRLQLDMEQMVSRYQTLLAQATTAKETKQDDSALVNQIGDLQSVNEQLRDEISRIKTENGEFIKEFEYICNLLKVLGCQIFASFKLYENSTFCV